MKSAPDQVCGDQQIGLEPAIFYGEESISQPVPFVTFDRLGETEIKTSQAGRPDERIYKCLLSKFSWTSLTIESFQPFRTASSQLKWWYTTASTKPENVTCDCSLSHLTKPQRLSVGEGEPSRSQHRRRVTVNVYRWTKR